MSWSKKILLAANFYGSYLHAEEFDDTVIIPDGGINQLLPAVERRVEVFHNLTNGEAEIIVFCVVGVTDMLEKTMQSGKYILKPITDSIRQIEQRMDNAVERLRKYSAKIIWSTTYPISLSKYHKSQGWDISNMFMWGFSRNMDMEQTQLYFMCEQFMDLCHSFNQRIGMDNCFFIRKVYYSHEGQRELLTHNLLEDGINPSPSVTADWNLELAKYLQAVRNTASASSGGGHLSNTQAYSTNLTPRQSVAAFGVGSGDTLFNYGAACSQPASSYTPGPSRFTNEPEGSSMKRYFESQSSGGPKTKRPKTDLEQALFDKLGNQSQDTQKKLAMGMLKFIAENVGDDMLGAANDTPKYPAYSSQENRYTPRASGKSFDNIPGNQYNAQKKRKPQTDVRSKREGASSNFAGNDAKRADGFGKFTIDNTRSSEGGPTKFPAANSRPRYEGGFTGQVAASVGPTVEVKPLITRNFQSGGGKKPAMSVKSRLNLSPNTYKAPLLTNPAIKPRSIKDRLDVKSSPGASKRVGHSADDYLLNQSRRDNRPGTGLLIEPRRHDNGRQVQLQLGSPPSMTRANPILPFVGRPGNQLNPPFAGRTGNQSTPPFAGRPGNQSTPPFAGRPGNQSTPPFAQPQSSGYNAIASMPKGVPDLLKSIVTGDEPLVKYDHHGLRDNYILMVVKTAPQTAKFSRVIADHDDREGDKLGIMKLGGLRFPCFSKARTDRSMVPSVMYLTTNQWKPGFEKSTAPMTKLQKEVASFNVALYQLMKQRMKLVKWLKKKKDMSISLPQKVVSAEESSALDSRTKDSANKTNDGTAEENNVSGQAHAENVDEDKERGVANKPDKDTFDDWEDMDDATEICFNVADGAERTVEESAKDDIPPLIVIDDDNELETYSGAQKAIRGERFAAASEKDAPVAMAKNEGNNSVGEILVEDLSTTEISEPRGQKEDDIAENKEESRSSDVNNLVENDSDGTTGKSTEKEPAPDTLERSNQKQADVMDEKEPTVSIRQKDVQAEVIDITKSTGVTTSHDAENEEKSAEPAQTAVSDSDDPVSPTKKKLRSSARIKVVE